MLALEDIELIKRIGEDDHQAFTALYDRYWDRLYASAYFHLKDAAAAEELVQDVFVTIWQKRRELVIQSLQPYLAAMLRYAIYRHLDSSRRRREHLRKVADAAPLTQAPEEIDEKLLLEMVGRLSDQLPEKCSLVFRASKLQDRALGEVAREMGISLKTAEAHLSKALKSIRISLGRALHLFFW
ncbi:sigma-70 family RNA polymerase sigma factor [Chitinophaga barathri]|uniref:sigma-70 family RNA polymerase sigma factor n=1 Tax=Chitinophaga barathri TaxID=1647451 RepID=UPI0019D486F4|nr:sigma-70 family RNA polymerase sigma factor [Chitinophaga barathri]